MLLDLVRLGFEELRPAVQAQPAEPRPVLGPAVDEEGGLGQDEEVPDPGEIVDVVGSLRLLVERAVEPRPSEAIVVADDEADRHEAGPAVGCRRRQGRRPRRRQERARLGLDDRQARHRTIMPRAAEDCLVRLLN